MRSTAKTVGGILSGILLALGSSHAAQAAGCGEASCVPAQGTYISHFTNADCTGTESYYLPYNSFGYQCRTYNGSGECGTIQRTVTNRSWRDSSGCHSNAWPSGNTLSQFVTVYRTYLPVACGFASTTFGYAPLYVSFNPNCSYDPDGGAITGYFWEFGDGQSSSFPYEYHTYWSPGYYPVYLSVVDDEGQSRTGYVGLITVK